MNTLLLTAADLRTESQAIITSSYHLEHIRTVHNAQIGDLLKLGMLNGPLGQGRIIALDHERIILGEITFNQEPPAPLPLTLLLALPRPKMLKRILQTVTTLGVKEIYLMNSYRVEKSYWQSPWLTPEAIHQQLLLGLEQGCDTQLPEVQLIKRFKPFVEDALPALIKGTRALVAHPYADQQCPRQTKEAITLAIGPEGGFIPYEVDLLQQAGFEPVSVGPRIMRVETAVPFLLGRIFG